MPRIGLPKSEDPRRLRENIAVYDFTLSPEDVARLPALDRGTELVLDPETFGHGAVRLRGAVTTSVARRSGT